MADNVPITAGSGTDIATDQVTGTLEHVQIMKIAVSTDGSRTLVPADGTNGLAVDVKGVVPGTGATNLGKAEDSAHADGHVGVMALGVVNNTPSSNTGDYATYSIAPNGGMMIGGCTAHDAADAGSPVKVGGRARSSAITSVASDDRTDAVATVQGYLVQHPYALPQSALTGTASSTSASDTVIIAAQGAGVTINLTTITIYNDSNTNTFVRIKDGTTTILVLPAPARGGAIVTFPFPLRITANTALNFASNTIISTMYVSAVGFAGI
jgi:hypothetical protein